MPQIQLLKSSSGAPRGIFSKHSTTSAHRKETGNRSSRHGGGLESRKTVTSIRSYRSPGYGTWSTGMTEKPGYSRYIYLCIYIPQPPPLVCNCRLQPTQFVLSVSRQVFVVGRAGPVGPPALRRPRPEPATGPHLSVARWRCLQRGCRLTDR